MRKWRLPCSCCATLTPPRQKHVGDGGKGSVAIAVYLQLYRIPTFVAKLASSVVPGWVARVYTKKKGRNSEEEEVTTNFTSQEFIAENDRFMEECERKPTFVGQPKPHKPSVFVCDNAPTHSTPEVKDALRQRGMQLEYLPPRSPDLTPNDSHFNGCCKNQYFAFINPSGPRQAKPSWVQAADQFVSLHETQDAHKHIVNWIMRLKLCVEVGGGAFEHLVDSNRDRLTEGGRSSNVIYWDEKMFCKLY